MERLVSKKAPLRGIHVLIFNRKKVLSKIYNLLLASFNQLWTQLLRIDFCLIMVWFFQSLLAKIPVTIEVRFKTLGHEVQVAALHQVELKVEIKVAHQQINF